MSRSSKRSCRRATSAGSAVRNSTSWLRLREWRDLHGQLHANVSELGWRVAVLEQHYTAGGATHSYDRAGYEWDVGVHYIGDMGARTTSRRMMDFLSQGNLQWAPMDSHYDRFFIGDTGLGIAGAVVLRRFHLPARAKP